jgi:DNA-binding CsgD family transcriptional regulator
MSVLALSVRVVAAAAITFWCFTVMSVAVFALPGEGRGPLYSVLAIFAGIVVPAAIGLFLFRGHLTHQSRPDPQLPERELLAMLETGVPITAVEAALRTSLSVGEAAQLLERLAGEGHAVTIDANGPTRYRLGVPRPDDAVLPISAIGLVESLSERELEVLDRLATGRSNREIAQDLYITVGTVKTHTNNIYRKLDARNRTEALARARSLGLLQS